MKKTKIGAIFTILFLGAAAVLGTWQIIPPEPAGEEIAGDLFSAERAFVHLQEIGKAPRVPGEVFHGSALDYIKNYLKELGIENEVQDVISISPDLRQVPFSSGKVKNIIGFLPGQDPRGNILLMAHYDSVPTGPGVGDDAIAVAAMLETARAIREGERPRNNIIFLFTDAHEYGLLGARAFLDQHPFSGEIDLVFNFEGQGPNGPVYMFETSKNGIELVRGLNEGVSHPLSSSLSEEVYELLNFDNDFRIFADRGYQGLGMAIVSDMAYYHSEKDNLDRLDLATLQHQGEYVIGLAKYFGNHNFEKMGQEDLVYFNLTRKNLVYYSQNWVIPLGIFGLFMTLGLLFFRKPKMSGVLAGILLVLICLGIGMGIISSLKEIAGFDINTYRSSYLQGGIAGLAIALTLALFYLGSRKFSLYDLGWGVIILWAFLGVISGFFLPGGSYVFFWPLLLGIINYIFPDKGRPFFPIGLVTAMGQIFFLTPLAFILYRALTMELSEIATGLVILVTCLAIPAFKVVFSSLGWWVPGTAAIVGMIFLLSGFASYDSQHPYRNTLIYHLDSDQKHAQWITFNETIDPWLEKYLGENPERREVVALSPFYPQSYIAEDAAIIDLPDPRVELMEESFLGDNRLLRLRISSPRGASVVSMYLQHGTEIISSSIGGRLVTREFSSQWYWGLRFFGFPQEGLEFELVVPANQNVELFVVEQSFGLEKTGEIGWKPRPEDIMAHPGHYRLTDSILVSKNFSF